MRGVRLAVAAIIVVLHVKPQLVDGRVRRVPVEDQSMWLAAFQEIVPEKIVAQLANGYLKLYCSAPSQRSDFLHKTAASFRWSLPPQLTTEP